MKGDQADLRPSQWVSHGECCIHSGNWIDLAVADVSAPDGTRQPYEVVRAQFDGAAALMVNDAAEILLIWRHRFIVDRWGWELPAGGIEGDESPTEAAVREAQEETGWEALQPRLIWSLSRCAERTDHIGHLVVVRSGRWIGLADDQEVAEIGWFGRPELYQLVTNGEIHDVFTLAAVLLWLNPGTAPRLSAALSGGVPAPGTATGEMPPLEAEMPG